ncbi:primase, DNA, polypeptide 1 (49kDa) [Clonorchis sinensis]|uniref:DNA primase n=1 Tax=Clonorchis sinensis TaxID=79923 RepID=A0A8T1MQH4_CLOSI|nr:primase, DNA, polypeptide 1 (49kDa) [Clonorchis sinensis]
MPDEEFSDDLLKFYYKKLFPCELFCKWLSYGMNDLARREFSFTLAGDVYLRYQSFETSSEFRKELVKLCPHKIDIGAVYSTAPKKHRAILPSSFKPEWKELVFDIDLTDYDEVRYCCGEQSDNAKSAVCSRCWLLAQSAVLCVDRALREDFGFEHLLWVYSGRRGVHCWVCDPAARKLDTVARTAIVEYLTLVRGGTSRKPVLTAGGLTRYESRGIGAPEPVLHPCVDAACDILLPRFAAYCSTKQGQDLFGVPARLKKLLSYLPEDLEELRSHMAEDWLEHPSNGMEEVSQKRWNTLRTFLKEHKRNNVLKELVLNYTYPRLDANVSTSLNHLLKSPFCIHPKTGYVCVPFDPQQVTSLNPVDVPTLSQLVEQARAGDVESSVADNSSGRHLLSYKRTALKASIDYFEAFIQRLCPADVGTTTMTPGSTVDGSHNMPSVPVF